MTRVSPPAASRKSRHGGGSPSPTAHRSRQRTRHHPQSPTHRGSGGGIKARAPGDRTPRIANIKGYTLGKTLGEGQYGKVKAARHDATGERYAVKIIDKLRMTPKQRRILRRETKIHALINHPHVTRVVEVIESATRTFIVSELCSGGSALRFSCCGVVVG